MFLTLSGCQDRDEKSVAFIEQFASVSYSHKGDCDAMGDALEKFVNEKREMLETAKQVDKSVDPEKREAFQKKYGKRVQAAGEKLMGSLFQCAKNQKVMNVIRLIN